MALKVSNHWTISDLLRWEQLEDWVAIAGTSTTLLKQNPTALELVLLARAYQSLSRWDECQQLLKVIPQTERKSTPVLARYYLIQARRYRSEGKAPKAVMNSLRALALSKKERNKTLLHESYYSLALSQAEAGEPLAALHSFDQLCKASSVAPLKKSKALVNRAWLLWDLGQIEALQSVVDEVPPALGFRFRLMLEIRVGKLPDLAYWNKIIHRLRRTDPSEVVQIMLLLLECHLIHKMPLKDFGTLSSLLRSLSLTSEHSKFILEALSICEESEEAQILWANRILGSLSSLDWRDQAERAMVALLFLKRGNQIDGLELYETHIDSVLNTMNCATPLIPRLERLRSPTNAFEQRLSSFLEIQNNDLATSDVQLVLRDSGLLCIDGNQQSEIALKRSPATLKLLGILVGKAGQEFSKASLHQSLTGSKYVAHLHDDRLYKLLQRLNQKLVPYLGKELVTFRGDNVLRLNIAILSDGI